MPGYRYRWYMSKDEQDEFSPAHGRVGPRPHEGFADMALSIVGGLRMRLVTGESYTSSSRTDIRT